MELMKLLANFRVVTNIQIFERLAVETLPIAKTLPSLRAFTDIL